MNRRVISSLIAAWMVALAGRADVASNAAPALSGALRERQVAIIYGDRENAETIAARLRPQGLSCTLIPQFEVETPDPIAAELVVVLSCCLGGYGAQNWDDEFLASVGDARLLACGDTGAALLQSRGLLIGHPNGWHNRQMPKTVVFPPAVMEGPWREVLLRPIRLMETPMTEFTLEIQINTNHTEHIGIYDGGHFPRGTTGIGREPVSVHHWIISRQGNYVLWGPNARLDELTEAGQNLFVNLCHYLVHSRPEPLLFPEKNYLQEGTHEGILIGGSQESFQVRPVQEGTLTLCLEWASTNVMMLMTHEPFVKRVDGVSPLTITHTIPHHEVTSEFRVHLTSFQIAEGEECPYRLTLSIGSHVSHGSPQSRPP